MLEAVLEKFNVTSPTVMLFFCSYTGQAESDLRAPPSSVFPTGGCAKNAAGDTNANALDSGLDALIAFLGVADESYATRCAHYSAPPDGKVQIKLLFPPPRLVPQEK